MLYKNDDDDDAVKLTLGPDVVRSCCQFFVNDSRGLACV